MPAKSKTLHQIRQELGDEGRISACACCFGVMGDETRFKICYLLAHHPELSVSEIASLVGVSVSTASHSIQKLRETHLVVRRKEAQKVFYSLSEGALPNLFKNYIKTI